MRGRVIGLILVVILGGILVACAPSEVPGEATQPAVDETAPTLQPALETSTLISRDLAARLQVGENEIVVESSTKIELPVGDLGCPDEDQETGRTQPGVVMGQELTLAVEGKRYLYHVHGKRIAYCGEITIAEKASEMSSADEEKAIVEKLDARGQEIVSQAREELAGELGVQPEKISVVEAEAMRWSDSSLGCPEPGKMYAQVITPGYRIVLEHEGEQYDYHTNQQGLMKLCKPE